MQIHVVAPEETLSEIAEAYGVPQGVLANQIPNPNNLVVGQTLVIPIWGRYHWVQPGESLWSIGQRYGVSVNELASINGISDPALIFPGLRLYIPQQARPPIDVGVYIYLLITGEKSADEVRRVGANLTYLQIFSYEMQRDGSLKPIEAEGVISAAYDQQVIPLMVITNIEDGQFSTELATTVLSDEALVNRLLDEAIAIMDEKGYLGLDFDLEYLGKENRERYNQLMRKAKVRLDERGYFLSSALAPKVRADQPGRLYEGHDYQAHGESADFIFIMTYESGWTGGPPLPVAPLNEVRRVLEYAVTEMPSDKIMMGIPLYGYDWTLPYVPGETRAKALSMEEANELAAKYNVAIQFDSVAQSPFFSYVNEGGKEHIVWFEDARSIQAKFDLVKELGLRGFYYWVLGRKFPQNWLLIEDNFVTRKRV